MKLAQFDTQCVLCSLVDLNLKLEECANQQLVLTVNFFCFGKNLILMNVITSSIIGKPYPSTREL